MVDFSGFLSGIDINEIFQGIVSFLKRLIGLPLEYWNKLPLPIRIGFYIFVFLFAVFMAWVTWKNRYIYRHRY
jgi:ABC-type lipoprotein release transport system permease subunit